MVFRETHAAKAEINSCMRGKNFAQQKLLLLADCDFRDRSNLFARLCVLRTCNKASPFLQSAT
jgi:hypothetical protein